MARRFLKSMKTKTGEELPLVWTDEAEQILTSIDGKRETRLLFDVMLKNDSVIRLLTTHNRLLSPVDIVADELSLPGEFRRPFVTFFPMPILVHTHGGGPLDEEDVMMAAASASVDAKMLWNSIWARFANWAGMQRAEESDQGQEKALSPADDETTEAIVSPEEVATQFQAVLGRIDQSAALEGVVKGVSKVAGGEALPLLRSLPLLPLGILTSIGMKHRNRLIEGSGLDAAAYTKALEMLVTARAIQLSFSMYCCKGHKDHPFAFLALGQSSPAKVACPICDKDLAALTYYHFEPTTSLLLRRPGGILEPMVWRIFEDAKTPYAPLARLEGIDEYERDAIFLSDKDGYGVVECKIWLRRLDEAAKREQLRRSLAQMDKSVSSMADRKIELDYGILVTNRYEEDMPDVIGSVVEEHNLESLQSMELVHINPKQMDMIKGFTKSTNS